MNSGNVLSCPSGPREGWGSGSFARMISFFLGVSALHAVDLPLTRLDSVSPVGLIRDQKNEITITGADLEGVDSVWFSHPGIQAAFIKDKVFSVVAGPEVPEGVYDMRLVGVNGVSNPRGIFLDKVRTVLKSGECSILRPMEIKLGEAVHGSVVAASRDCFRFNAQKDQRVVVRCQAQELDSRLTPVLSLLDATGRRISSSIRREFLEFKAPETGSYVVTVQDIAYAGGTEYFYRLILDESPVLDFAVPSVLVAGKKNRIQLFGRGLEGARPSGVNSADGRELEVLEMEIEPGRGSGVDGAMSVAGAGFQSWSYRHRSQRGVSNAIHFGVFENDTLVESVGLASTLRLPVPGIGSGVFAKGFAGAPVEFEAKKGETIIAEVLSNRLNEAGSNPYLRLSKDGTHLAEAYGPEGNAGGPRLSTIHNDPILRFECKEDGKYTIHLTDLSGAARPGRGGVYAIKLAKEDAGFALIAATEPPPETANDRIIQARGSVLRAGGTAALRIVAMRNPGFTGEIHLKAENLPEGVTCSPGRIVSGKNEAILIFHSKADVGTSLAAVRITGSSVDGKLVREARWATSRWTVQDFNLAPHEPRLGRGAALLLATTKTPAPLALSVEGDSAVEVKQGAKFEVDVRVKRSAEFKEVLKIKLGGFAGSETFKEVDLDAKSEVAKIQIDTAALKLPPGTHVVYFTTQTKAKVAARDVVTTVYSPSLEIAVRAPDSASTKKAEPAAKPAAEPK